MEEHDTAPCTYGVCEAMVQHYLDAGDEERAFEVLVQLHAHAVYEFCVRSLGRHHQADAEDAAQNALCKARQNLSTFRGPGSIKAWLLVIARNCCWDRYREERRGRRLWRCLIAGEPPNPPEPIRDELEVVGLAFARLKDPDDIIPELVEFALTRLQRHDKALLIMKDGHDLTFPELSHALGESVPALHKRAQRARQKLIQVYEGVRLALTHLERHDSELLLMHDIFGLTLQKIQTLLFTIPERMESGPILKKHVRRARYRFNQEYKKVANHAAPQ